MNEPIFIEAKLGEHIATTARRLVDAAIANDHATATTFNGVELVAYPASTVGDLLACFDAECEKRQREWQESPKGKKAEAERQERIRRLQVKHDRLIEVLPRLDFTDLAALIDWLCEFQEPSDHVGVKREQGIVVDAFRSHGYKPNVNLGDDLDRDDRENVARYLIGQALSCLIGVGAIHQIFPQFASEWREKFREVVSSDTHG